MIARAQSLNFLIRKVQEVMTTISVVTAVLGVGGNMISKDGEAQAPGGFSLVQDDYAAAQLPTRAFSPMLHSLLSIDWHFTTSLEDRARFWQHSEILRYLAA